jgi:hypothetical protein
MSIVCAGETLVGFSAADERLNIPAGGGDQESKIS